MKMYLKVIGCSCCTCLPHTAPAAAQTGRKMAAPGTGTGGSSDGSTSTHEHMAKNNTHINIHANTNKS